MAWDLHSVRSAFPALARTGPGGTPLAYLDGPAGSQVPESVIAAMGDYLRGGTANSGGAFVTSGETDALVDRARVAAADLTGATADEMAFGPNMTTLNFALAHAVARTLRPGDVVVTTELDHDANVAPWLRVAEDHGLTVRQVPLVPATGDLDYSALDAIIDDRTRIVAFTLASNALGTIPDAARITAAARRVGALTWADAVHYAPHRRMDRTSLDVDVLLCSTYKFCGPHTGIAMIRRDLAETWPADRVRPADEWPPAHRFETGTPSFEALAGVVAAIDYLAALGPDARTRAARLDGAFTAIAAHETDLVERFLGGLASLAHVRLWGRPGAADRTATFCLSIAGWRPRDAAAELAARGILTWDGNYYALSAMRALDLEPEGALRIGFLHYTGSDEVDRVVEALADLA